MRMPVANEISTNSQLIDILGKDNSVSRRGSRGDSNSFRNSAYDQKSATLAYAHLKPGY